ncbi:hypothetical protein EBA02_07020 [Xanthomonas oryzae pv. oryzae]|nr:hypothetical protein EBA02_07020 [Xanthomonas oryzae pv. oryzae]
MNASVYRLLLMDTSESVIFYDLEMSRKHCAYQVEKIIDVHFHDVVHKIGLPKAWHCHFFETIEGHSRP